MKMFWRILIVFSNLILIPVELFIKTIIFLVAGIWYKDREILEFIIYMCTHGVKGGIEKNIKFLKTGDLNVFDLDL